MHYHELFHQLYNELCTEPDFPIQKAEKLWSNMPQGSRDMATALYLLPFGKNTTPKEQNHGKIIMLLTLSAFTHGDLERNRAFSNGEAVLYGDYLFALAISLIPDDFRREEAQTLLERSYRFGENRLRHKKGIASAEDYLAYARDDYGELLKSIAAEGAERSGMNENQKDQYTCFAETLGTAWGILCEGYPIDHAPLLDKAETYAHGLEQESALIHILKNLRGTADENHS